MDVRDAGGWRRRPPRVILVLAIFLAAVGVAGIILLATLPPAPRTLGCALECGSFMSWGSPLNTSGSISVGCPSSVDHYCYSIELAGWDVSIESFLLSLRSPDGSGVPWPYPSVDAVSLVNPENSIVATYSTISSSWTPQFNTSVVIGGDTVVIYTSQVGPGYGLDGLSIVAEVTGPPGDSGTIPSSAFP